MTATSLLDRRLPSVDDKSGVPVDFSRQPLWLLHGHCRAGNDFEVGHGR